ncbi:SpoIIE family protein phosphatase [Streptomyces sp. 3MP-14]|uniref:SpoIIE family protein phosphatase n=1 Tax=Streptomyces mimosae TaxID=2586635 RepID=A0A5N5ZVQ6_9ACTN|nr:MULTISPECIES: SpoIIE family protein phosphatase [Streptomyces]KAB8159450.1 SpoIIE family protein phosphatase [Streptomyces mimosae]KAB8172662.1 SpoIIE family protein phosphatase [Streptomyces sp. 3MP-14]
MRANDADGAADADGDECPDDGGPLADTAVALVERRGVVVGWSRAAEELLERPAAEVLGRSVLRLLTEADRAALAEPAGSPPERGEVTVERGAGRPVAVRYQARPLREGAGTAILAVTAEWALEAEHAESLSRALLSQERIGYVLRDAELTVVRTNVDRPGFAGPPLPPGSRLSDVMGSSDAAGADAALRGVLETGEPLTGQDERVRSTQPPYGDWSWSVSALRTEDRRGRPTGIAILLTDPTDHWKTARRSALRHRAARIGGTLDIEGTAQEIVDTLVPDFADFAWVDLADPVLTGDEPPKTLKSGELHLRRVAVRAMSGAWPPELLRPGQAVPRLPDHPMVHHLQEGRTIVVDRATFEEGLDDPARIRHAAPERGHSLSIAPLFARGLVLGVVAVWRAERPEPFDEEDVGLLTEIAAHAALSVDNARRYTREHRAAVALQRRLLPKASTVTPVMETAGAYLPAAGGAGLGGDWFDAIELPCLRTALVVGDVTGHGLHATATMGRLRTAVGTLADLELAPDELLTHLDDLVKRLAGEADPAHRDVVSATCLVAVHDPVSGRCVMAAAGHPPPLLLVPDGPARPVPIQPGPPLGVGGLPFETASVDVPPGSVLALYTDGLVLRYGDDLDSGTRGLADRLARVPHAESDLAALTEDLMTPAGGAPLRDDAALLLARTSRLAADAVAGWEFPAEPGSVASAREAATGALAAWGLEDSIFATELIVSELVTNAVRFAGGPVGLRLIRGEALFCEVTDPSNTQPRMRRARSTDEGGRGLFLVAQLSSRWGSRYGPSGKTIWVEQELPA